MTMTPKDFRIEQQLAWLRAMYGSRKKKKKIQHSREGECARRVRQMRSGYLKYANGLNRECRTGPSHHRLRYSKEAQT